MHNRRSQHTHFVKRCAGAIDDAPAESKVRRRSCSEHGQGQHCSEHGQDSNVVSTKPFRTHSAGKMASPFHTTHKQTLLSECSRSDAVYADLFPSLQCKQHTTVPTRQHRMCRLCDEHEVIRITNVVIKVKRLLQHHEQAVMVLSRVLRHL